MPNVISERQRENNKGVIICCNNNITIFTKYQDWKLRILNNKIIKCDHDDNDYICLERDYVNAYREDTLMFSMHINEFKAYILLR
tara:strand:+ start:18409 stop:18663 length:255 start_codon:yes stop_codon:yes gene_type:complete